MMIETPIAFGVTMAVCLALFFYCWRIRKIRNRLTSIQVSATPDEAPIVEELGIKKEVVDAFPTVMSYELKGDVKEGLQCPICLVEYGDAEVLRKLPFCGHVFHIRCVESWLEKQITCPVCRIVLTGAAKLVRETSSRHPLQASYCRSPTNANSVFVEVAADMPAWVLVNRPLPLPPAIPEDTSLNGSICSESSKFGPEDQSSDCLGGTGESPLLKPLNGNHIVGWGAVYLEKGPIGLSFRSHSGEIAIESRDCINHSSISERWMTESFSFGIASSDDVSSIGVGSSDSPDAAKHSRSSSRNSRSPWRSDSSKRNNRDSRTSWSSHSTNSSWDFNQPTMKHWQTDFGYSSAEVVESNVAHHLPLTISPEHCSFEFLPIITGPGGDSSSRPPKPTEDRPRVGTSRKSYFQL